MKFVTFRTARDADLCWGIVEGSRVYVLDQYLRKYPTLDRYIQAEGHRANGAPLKAALTEAKQEGNGGLRTYKMDEIIFAPPYKPAKNIICVGKNYSAHIQEMAANTQERDVNTPEAPVLFTKPPTAIRAHQQTVSAHDDITNELDYEGELVVIIGKQGRNIAADKAVDYIFGYSILNDITARDLQRKHRQFFKGKSLDESAPFGPWIVHKHAIPNAQRLAIRTYVDEELRQNGNTGQMIFPIYELISTISAGMTLEAGDMIATGTPAGVGNGFDPPRFLRSGQRIRIEIESIGTLENEVHR